METNSQTTPIREKTEAEIRQDQRIEQERNALARVRKENTPAWLYEVTRAGSDFRNRIEDGTAIVWSTGELLVHVLAEHGLKIERIENDDPVI